MSDEKRSCVNYLESVFTAPTSAAFVSGLDDALASLLDDALFGTSGSSSDVMFS